MTRVVYGGALVVSMLITSPVAATPVAVSWFGEIPSGANVTNPSVAVGETWEISYLIDNATPDNDADPNTGKYVDGALTATISFSGGYSSPVSANPGITMGVIDGALTDIVNTSAVGFSAVVRLPGTTLASDQFPADGNYAPQGVPAGTPVFIFGNDDGLISYFDSNGGYATATLTTLGGASDGNLDGLIDGLDYLVWATGYPDNPAADPPGPPTNGDYNGDNKVDGHDYLVWAADYAATHGQAIPEPGTATLFVLSLLSLATIRPRRIAR
jgi:hypothetical protein